MPGMGTPKVPVKAALFDFWNTLVYDIPEIEARRAVDRCERITRLLTGWGQEATLAQVTFAYNGVGKVISEKAVSSKAITIREQVRLMLEIIRIDPLQVSVDMIEEAYNRPVATILCPAVNGSQALIERLSRKYKLGLISNTERTSGQYLQIAYPDILKRFSFCFFSDERKIRKPNHEAFLVTATELSVDPSECVMIGDSVANDCQPAIDCGMKAIHFTDPAIGKKEQFYPQISNLSDIPRALEKI